VSKKSTSLDPFEVGLLYNYLVPSQGGKRGRYSLGFTDSRRIDRDRSERLVSAVSGGWGYTESPIVMTRDNESRGESVPWIPYRATGLF